MIEPGAGYSCCNSASRTDSVHFDRSESKGLTENSKRLVSDESFERVRASRQDAERAELPAMDISYLRIAVPLLLRWTLVVRVLRVLAVRHFGRQLCDKVRDGF